MRYPNITADVLCGPVPVRRKKKPPPPYVWWSGELHDCG